MLSAQKESMQRYLCKVKWFDELDLESGLPPFSFMLSLTVPMVKKGPGHISETIHRRFKYKSFPQRKRMAVCFFVIEKSRKGEAAGLRCSYLTFKPVVR